MKKFIACDILKTLCVLMKMNTERYHSDFEVDKQIIHESARSKDPTDKFLLWLSRTNGTHCLLEKDVYTKGTYAHNTWKYYADQHSQNIIAFAVEITSADDYSVMGNLYQLDYYEHCRMVNSVADEIDIEQHLSKAKKQREDNTFYDEWTLESLLDFLNFKTQFSM